MCGIIGYIGNEDAIRYLLNGLKQLQNRGYDSAGICTVNNIYEFILTKYASSTGTSAIDLLQKEKEKHINNTIGIGHTRWATHGPKTDDNAHPHTDSENTFCIVHNGIIENYKELKNKLVNKGYKFKSQTDTEVISNLLLFHYKETKNVSKAIQNCIGEMHGTWGICIVCKDEKNKIYVIRNGSPILISKSDQFVLISSEQSGFCNIVNEYFCLKENDICCIEKKENSIEINTEQIYDVHKVNKSNMELTPDPYPYWTIKEIEEQVDSSLRAISMGGRLLSNDSVKLGGLESNKNELINIDNLILVGCGTSLNASKYAVNVFKEMCNFNLVVAFDGAEFSTRDLPKKGKNAIILLSQSGETIDLINAISIASENDVILIGIVNVTDSLIARETNCGCYLNAGREVAVASTKSFTSQMILLSMVSIWFSQIHNINHLKRIRYINNLRNLYLDIKKTLQISKEMCSKFSEKIIKSNSCFILGKGKSHSIALEGALKIKEISYIHAEGYSGSSLKHGPFGLLEKNFPVILIMPNDEHYVKMQNVYEEIKSREADIYIITDNNKCDLENSIILPRNESYSYLLAIIPLQLLAYYLSIKKNINPDFPRNLAKVVTVE